MLYGVPFGVLMGLFAAYRRHGSNVVAGLIVGIISGVLFGVLMTAVTRRQQAARDQRTAAFTAGLTAQSRKSAMRASRRGPVPGDPATRAAAAALTRDRLEQSISQRRRSLTGFSVLALLQLVQALTSSPWFWLGVLLFATSIVAQLREPRKLRRRLSRLTA